MSKNKQIEFNTEINDKDVVFYGNGSDVLTGVSRINWNVVLYYDESGIYKTEYELISIYVECEQPLPEDSRANEFFLIGNKLGCEKSFNPNIHTYFDDEFSTSFEMENPKIEDVIIYLEKKEIELL